jgi:hypothetical protein
MVALNDRLDLVILPVDRDQVKSMAWETPETSDF